MNWKPERRRVARRRVAPDDLNHPAQRDDAQRDDAQRDDAPVPSSSFIVHHFLLMSAIISFIISASLIGDQPCLWPGP